MVEEKAALKIQRFFASYRSQKQTTVQQAISTSPASKLLRAFDLRFQCMRAVAAAKFPINKPIEDAAQVARVIASIRELAEREGIVNLDAIERLFHQSILLAERIQAPYYYVIWNKTYPSTGVDSVRLINHAYQQLCSVVRSFELSIACDPEKVDAESLDVLGLAREIIQHASKTIVEVLVDPRQVLNEISREEFTTTFEKMLAEYMTPNSLLHSKENIQFLAQDVALLCNEGMRFK